jgi:ABC-type antimicrobial peptide transport system permease subunit
MRRWSELMSIAIRTSIPPTNVLPALRHEVLGATGDQVLYEVRTLERLAHDSLARQRFLMLLFGIFAALALTLASIGIYGVLAYLTSQRVAEIGLRMALGASGGDVVRMILRQSLAMIFGGVALGTGAAWAAGRLLERLVEGIEPTGPSTFLMTIPILAAAALVASFLPARRASRVDPVKALRQE